MHTLGTTITCDINIHIDHPIDHQRHHPLHHRYSTSTVCIDTITINRISIDVSKCGMLVRPNGPRLVFPIRVAPGFISTHRDFPTGNEVRLYKVSSIEMSPSTNETRASTGPRAAVFTVAGTVDLHIRGNIVIASKSLQSKTNGSQITR